MIESWDSGFCERVGVCAGLFFFCERDVCERDAREACAACRRGFVGGWLLGCRESAKSVFQKSELASLKQRTFEKQRRFPPSKKRTPPAEAEPASILSLGCAFRPERRKQACRGTEAGAVAPCPGCVEFLIVYMD